MMEKIQDIILKLRKMSNESRTVDKSTGLTTHSHSYNLAIHSCILVRLHSLALAISS